MKNSVHKALEGEPRQGKPDVQGWCFPGQNPGDVSIAPVFAQVSYQAAKQADWASASLS